MKIELTEKQHSLIEKAIRYMISNLQYERHQAFIHGCNTGSYNEEIEEYRQLKIYINDNRSAKG